MDKWEKFEIAWTEFLKKTYGDVAYFERMGGSDSTKPDILVRRKNGTQFFIETKMCPAQCGQFVLLPDKATRTFKYSERNENPINEFAETIMRFMDRHFDSFVNAGTSGITLEFNNMEDVFCNWIMKIYREKDVEIFATNDFMALPLSDFPKFFNVTAKYRIKRSGSSPVGNTRVAEIVNYIKNNYAVFDIKANEEGAVFCKSTKNLHNLRFEHNGIEYMFSYREGIFEVRRLSNTFNANVIFSITLKHPTPKAMSKDEFEKHLKGN